MIAKAIKSSAIKWLLIIGGLSAAAAGPMAVSSAPGWWSSLKTRWLSPQKAEDAKLAEAGVGPAAISPEALPPASGAFPENAQPLAMADIFRFDVTIRQLTERWPRVSTSLPDLQLQGYRVPLVTGTAETDLAGSLTYYFDSVQQVQRISFNGTTGDGRELLRLLTGRFGFVRRPTREANLLVYEVPVRRGPAQSVVQLKLAPLLKSSVPHQRFDVTLVIERPAEEPLISRVLGDRG